MIVTDTYAVNTGAKVYGVVVCLQEKIKSASFEIPICIDCQHHILDTILKHALNQLFCQQTESPKIDYYFISLIVESYKKFKK